MLYFLTIFNLIFSYAFYPASWCYNKLITLFKNGDRFDCANYRGISIMDTLAKVYDTLLMVRLSLWCSIDKCQAGAQEGRGCIEQIVSLRLLIDYAFRKKKKLYCLFVDFSKAYDRVPRVKMISHLRSMGCGKRMLLALHGIYKCTKNILKSAIISSAIGVRQGAPISCLLFVMYIDKMIKMIKEQIGEDGYLGMLHALLMMDDTVILATSRVMCERKLTILARYCSEYGMVINEKKTNFFVINGSETDNEPFVSNGLSIQYCPRYLYLGAWFTDVGTMESVLALHETQCTLSINKFAVFCAANTTMPFQYKMKVFNAAITASLLYSSESWITPNVKCIEKLYNKLIKCLLGVRSTTPTSLCLVEIGLNDCYHEIIKKRKNFLISKLNSINQEEPFHIVFDLCKRGNTVGYRILSRCLEGGIEGLSLEQLKYQIRNKPDSASKFVTYRSKCNLGLEMHNIYSKTVYIPDYLRISFTRLRLMSHNLKIETGR